MQHRVAQLTVKEGELPQLVYLHADHLNTPRKATNELGQVVWQWLSDAFGSSLPNEDVDADGELITIDLRFPGQIYDAESGLYYNYYRYYDPQLGRYITSDPIGLNGGINTFAYVGGNPVGLVDPLGLEVTRVWNTVHPSIRIESSTNPSINGQWSFGPDSKAENFSYADWLGGAEVPGQVHSESMSDLPISITEVMDETDNSDQKVYDNIQNSLDLFPLITHG